MKNLEPGKLNGQQTRDKPQKTTNLNDIISFRFPIFNQNKPYVYLKISKTTDKYRLSLSPEFLKQYNLSFRIFRNKSLDDFLAKLNETSRLNSNFNKLDFRLPKKEIQEVNKVTYLMDIMDNTDDVIEMEKYTFINKDPLKAHPEDTVVFIIERTIRSTDQKNLCIAFISRQFLTFEDFVRDLDIK